MGAGEQAVSTDAVRAELTRILESPHFDASERNRQFLAYVVEEALAGRTDRIKAYTIATEVFGRDPEFRPAARLRSSASRPAACGVRSSATTSPTAGRATSASTFRAAATRRSSARRPVALPHSLAGSPRVLVTAFEEEGDQSSFPTFTRGFTRSLIIALTRFTGLRVFGAETALRHPADIDPERRPTGACRRLPGHRPDLAPAGRLRGGHPARRGGERPGRLGRDLRARVCSHPRSSRCATRWRTGSRGRWRQPYGAIQSDRARDADGPAPETLGSYAAVLLFYAYWRTFDRR